MTRPALIVGLGGTGQWVLTYLKKDLMESNGGVLPENVKLLAFDTMPQASVATESAASNQEKNQDIKVGSVHLETNTEFFHLGGDMRGIGEILTSADSVKRQSLPHIDSWFAAQHWMETLPRASWVLATGAGQLRQFGRLGLFQDLADPGRSQIWSRIDVAARSLERNLGRQRLEIVVVGSFAGGTGSGMLIDFGLLLRQRTKGVNSMIRGYFALPRVFDQNPDDDLKARSFAAWRELNRFMTVSADFPMPALVYNPKDERLQIASINHRLYDACYLIDGMRAGHRIDAEPEKIVFPAVADAISALLDDTAGGHYTEYVGTNLAPEYAKKRGVPLYSAVGAHSFKVPVYYAQQEFSYNLAANLLDALVRPLRDDPKNPNRITGVAPTSPYSPNRIGREDANDLLTKDHAYLGNSEESTLFTKRVSDIVNEGGSDNQAIVDSYAAGSLTRTQGGRTWLENFTEFGNRLSVEALTSEIRSVVSLRLTSSIKPSKEVNENPRNGPRRFAQDIPSFVSKNYGGRDAQGNDYGGRFGEALDKAHDLQVDIFQRNAHLWLMKTLMGEDPENAMAAKRGRIGYAHSLLEGCIERWGQFLDFMGAVEEKRRVKAQPRLRVEELRNRRKKEMEDHATSTILGLVPAPKAHASQDRYLQAEQSVIDVRKDELLHRHVEKTARSIRQVAITMRDELGRWIQMLATGDSATGITGLHELLETNRLLVRNTASADAQLASQTTLPGPQYEQDTGELERLMRAITWRIDPRSEELRLTLSIESEDEGSMELERTTGRERSELRMNLTQRNLSKVLDYARRRFSRLPGETRIAQRLAEDFSYDAVGFISAIGDKAEPFFSPLGLGGGSSGGAAKWAKMVRISMDREKMDQSAFDFVRDIQTEMRKRYGADEDVKDQDRLVQVVGSSDYHKCTLVYTDDLYEVEHFEAWEDCQNAYLRNRQLPPYLNHNFPAETNAAQLELEITKRRGSKYHVLHPWIVMLLEYRDRLEQFLVLKALGRFELKADGVNEWFELNLPNQRRPFILTTPSRARPGLFQLMHSFVLSGRELLPTSNRKIDYEEVSKAIYQEEKDLEAKTWLDMLQNELKTHTDGQLTVRWIDAIPVELEGLETTGIPLNKDEPDDFARAYADLSAMAALLLERRIEEKKQKATKSSFL